MSKIIVVDACIAQSASDSSEAEEARQSRLFLDELKQFCHRVAFCQELLDEWKLHQSRYAKGWMKSMFAKKKVVRVEFDEFALEQITALPEELEITDREREELAKDLHLLKAALSCDGIIASSDELTRGILRRNSESIADAIEIVWVNPRIAEEHPIEWLNADAPPDLHRKLSYNP